MEEIKNLEAVQEEQNEVDGIITIKLRKPIEYVGKTYDTLHLDLDGLTGADGLNAENELMQRKIGPVIYAPMNNNYLITIASKACQEPLGYDAFLQMSLKDYNNVVLTVRNFLLK